jgi:hypothetical protein
VGVAATLFCSEGTPGAQRERLAVAAGFGWQRMPAVGSSSGRRLASIVPAASRKKEECLGTMEGGEGWPVVAITKNGAAAEHVIGGGENFKSAQLRLTWWTR